LTGPSQLCLVSPLAAIGGVEAFKSQLAAHLATYAASGGAEPGQVLEARTSFRGRTHLMRPQEGGVIWYPLREMTFLQYRSTLNFPHCVLHGQHQLRHRAPAQLHVFVPAVQPEGDDAVVAAASGQAGIPVPGRLQLPGLWREVGCVEVTVGIRGTSPDLYRPGGWGSLQHLHDHYRLALSMVSGSLQALPLHC
jgi:hypothetical protein